jgi:hypothetical protein
MESDRQELIQPQRYTSITGRPAPHFEAWPEPALEAGDCSRAWSLSCFSSVFFCRPLLGSSEADTTPLSAEGR